MNFATLLLGTVWWFVCGFGGAWTLFTLFARKVRRRQKKGDVLCPVCLAAPVAFPPPHAEGFSETAH